MVIRVLSLNVLSSTDAESQAANIEITPSAINKFPTLHDFHAIIMDMKTILDEGWWRTASDEEDLYGEDHPAKEVTGYAKRIKEQIETGGVTFCFASAEVKRNVFTGDEGSIEVSNHSWCPVDLGIVSEKGVTFYPRAAELRQLSLLFEDQSLGKISWSCYFSKVPDGARVLGTNRAGYSVCMEIPLGEGKLIMLPRFGDITGTAKKIISEIIPKIIHEEEFAFAPGWLQEFSSPFEDETKRTLQEIQEVKKLLFTKDKLLKKAVALAFEKLGFKVEILPDGTRADLRLVEGKQVAIVEVKGHNNRQAQRDDVLQLLGYLSETSVEEKGIVVCNHEFNKKPTERDENAFTDGAIQLGNRNCISLVSSLDMHKVVMKVLEKEIDAATIKRVRDSVMGGSGIVHLT